jgi:hypothetical protein
MIASISNAGSGNAAASAPKASSRPANSFVDVLDSLVEAPATASTSSTAPASAGNSVDAVAGKQNQTQPALGAATAPAKPESQDTKHAAPAPNVKSHEVSDNVEPGAAASTACSDTHAADVADEKPGEEDHDNDGDDGANSPILLSLISAAIPVAVPPANLRLQGASSRVESAAASPVDSIQLPGSQLPGSQLQGSVLPAPAPQLSVAADAHAPSVAATATQYSAPGAAGQAINAEQTPTSEQPAAPGQEPADQIAAEVDAAQAVVEHGELPQTADPQQQVQADSSLNGIPRQPEIQTPQATVQAVTSTPTVSNNVAASQVRAVEDGTTQAQPVVPDGGTMAAQIKAQASRAELTNSSTSGSKERASAASDGNEPEREVKSTAASVSADPNPDAQIHTKQSGESVVRQDVLSQHAEVQQENHSRSEKPLSAASTETASAGNSAASAASKSNLLNSSRLMQRISQSELRVGIPSDFGDIAVRTAMNRHQLSAEISVQHAGLRDAIVAEMPSLQARLSEQHIPLADVSVTANAGDGSNAGTNSFQQWSHNGQQGAKSSSSPAGEGSNDRDSAASVDVLERGAGLDIRI